MGLSSKLLYKSVPVNLSQINTNILSVTVSKEEDPVTATNSVERACCSGGH